MKVFQKFYFWAKVALLVFAGIAVLFAILSLSFLSQAEPAVGTVVDVYVRIDDEDSAPSYYPTVEYQVGDEVYRVESSVGGSSNYEIGSPIEILYRADRPEKMRPDTLWGVWAGSFIFASLVLLMGLLLWGLGHHMRKRRQLIDRLRAAGVRISAEVTNIETIHMQSRSQGLVTSVVRFVIHAKAKYNGIERSFKSDRLPQDPQDHGLRIGDTVTVWIDSQDPQISYVDVSFMPDGEYTY